jgi:signal transduction histidine kinase
VRELFRNEQFALERLRELRARQQLEEQLRHSRRLESLGRLAGGISHHFNNLLAVILGFSELALRGLSSESQVRRDIEEVHRAATRAAELTRQLLEFSRKQALQPGIVDLNTLVSNLANMLRLLIKENIALHLELQPQLRPVNADAGSIEQVIMNLVVNARDAMPDGGKITIQTAEIEIGELTPTGPPSLAPGPYVTVTVRDTGVGMDREVQEQAFEPFFTTKDVGRGTGLGLSIVYGTVKQHGGDIRVDSKRGEGTTFVIYLPPAQTGQV